MSLNFTKENLIVVPKENVKFNTPAILINNDIVFLLRDENETPTGGSAEYFKCVAVGANGDSSSSELPEPVFNEPFDGSLTNNFTQLGSAPEFTTIASRQCMVCNHEHRLSAPATNMPSGNSARTISAWVYFNSFYEWSFYFGYGGNDYNTFDIGTMDSYLHNYHKDDYTSLANMNTGQWYHIVMTFNGTTMQSYVNGVAQGSYEYTYDTDVANYPIYIGYLGSQADSTFNQDAYISDARIYDIALTAEQVMKLYDPDYAPLLPNTWNGQKAILLTDEETGKPYYDFEETVTEGLTFGNGFTPVVDGIYDREAMVKIEALFSGSAKYAANETVVAVMPSASTKMYTKFKVDISSNAVVDWGDGTVETLTNSGEYQHEYAEADKEYIVKIGGDAVNSINFIDPRYSNWTDNTVKRLIQLGNSLTSMYKMFASTSLQRIEDSCQIPENVESMNYALGADNLEYAPASLRLPDRCTDFENAFVNARKLRADITNWFDNFTTGGKVMSYAFYGGSELIGTPNSNKLWDSGWSWNGTSSCFSNCSKLSNFNDIPSNWK
jgi:hypothetical protein